MKRTKDKRAAVTAAATGEGLRALGMRRIGRGDVVMWNEDGSCVRPGPESTHYEASRAECGAHLLFNAFWAVANCCVHQLLMKDPMHQIDLGIIIRLSSLVSGRIRDRRRAEEALVCIRLSAGGILRPSASR